MNAEKVMKRDDKYVAHTYGRSPLVLEKGRGMEVWDAQGREYLDFTSGIGVNSLGFCHPDWVAAVEKQLVLLPHTSNLYYTAPCGKLAKKICKLTGMDKVFFGNSGAEANEGAIKAARKYSVDKYGPHRSTILTLQNSFHGRTLATLTATGQEVFHQDFGPFNKGFRYVPANDFAALKEAADDSVCAVLFECVQGEGGVVALDPAFVHNMVNFCRQKDILLVADEVQTGAGRTGTFLACEHYGFTPDIATLAKGLGGGLPIGAVLMKEAVAQHMGPGSHGSTFGGNPVVCAGALAVVEKLADHEFILNVSDRAAQLRAGLAGLPHVTQISGLGLMVGIQLEEGISAAQVRTACQEEGLLVLTAKSRLRLLPPLILTSQDVERALRILEHVLANWPTEMKEETEEDETPAENE